jgi:transposase-like protein
VVRAVLRRFLTRALAGVTPPTEVTTDRAPANPRIVEDMLPGALHIIGKYANNRVEADHGWLQARLRPMRGIKKDRSLWIIATGHAFILRVRTSLVISD